MECIQLGYATGTVGEPPVAYSDDATPMSGGDIRVYDAFVVLATLPHN